MMKSPGFAFLPMDAAEAASIASIPWQDLIVKLTTQHQGMSSESGALSFAQLYVAQESRCQASQSFLVPYLNPCQAYVVFHHSQRG